jgi:hypothetical protein
MGALGVGGCLEVPEEEHCVGDSFTFAALVSDKINVVCGLFWGSESQITRLSDN